MKRVLKTLKNIFVLVSMIAAIVLLIHDFIFWGIVPAFTHQYYCITYFGMIVDLSAYFVIKIGTLYFEKLFK